MAKYTKSIFSTLKMKIVKNEVMSRALSKTPKFWTKVQKIFMSIGGLALTLWMANKELDLEIGEPMSMILRQMIIVSIIVTGTAQLTKDDNNETNS